MKFFIPVILLSLISMSNFAQSNTDLPYRSIPDYPESYTAGTVLSRMIDGLGFRYYWATDSLRQEDLDYKPSDEARTTFETIQHIYGLSRVVVNATRQQANGRDTVNYTFDEYRRLTLNNLKEASETLLQSSPEDIEGYIIDFGARKYPYWNNINGPIADAIWHVGQIVSFRRSSGNPFNSKASLFNGKLRE